VHPTLFYHFGHFLPKIVKIGGNLTKLQRKQFRLFFYCDTVCDQFRVWSADVGGGYSSRSLTVSAESWIGHPMDPIGCLFSVLLNAADGTSTENRTGKVFWTDLLCILHVMQVLYRQVFWVKSL